MDPLLSQKQAARIVGLSVRTLERHRLAGTGPRYARLGRLIRYQESDLAEWVRNSLRASTSQHGAPAAGRANTSDANPQVPVFPYGVTR
jgi:predicted DNA-binding transcriptional regulator AlpA